MQQNRNGKLLFSKERTVVPRNEADTKPEIPMFSTSYQDKRRGWSLDPWVGKQVHFCYTPPSVVMLMPCLNLQYFYDNSFPSLTQIDPAGREEPFSRQESFGCIPAFGAPRAPGYTGYVPSKVAENVAKQVNNPFSWAFFWWSVGLVADILARIWSRCAHSTSGT